LPVVTRQRLAIQPDFRLSIRQEIVATELLHPAVVRGRPLLVGDEGREARLTQGRDWF
jgi:hypothetical protein